MIRFKSGDILAEEAEALVNTVNCVGVMGRGIAFAVQEGVPRELSRLREGVCAKGCPTWQDVLVRDGATCEPTLHHQLPDQAPLACQEPGLTTST